MTTAELDLDVDDVSERRGINRLKTVAASHAFGPRMDERRKGEIGRLPAHPEARGAVLEVRRRGGQVPICHLAAFLREGIEGPFRLDPEPGLLGDRNVGVEMDGHGNFQL